MLSETSAASRTHPVIQWPARLGLQVSSSRTLQAFTSQAFTSQRGLRCSLTCLSGTDQSKQLYLSVTPSLKIGAYDIHDFIRPDDLELPGEDGPPAKKLKGWGSWHSEHPCGHDSGILVRP